MKQNRQKIGFGFLSIVLQKHFDKTLLQNVFFVVPLNSHCCESPENAIKPKAIEEKLT
jgi:hypothetical protein